jgi:hypothetical protein
VPVDTRWFDSVLGVVEREVMDLPDGQSFRPDSGLSGMEYLGIIGKLKKQYR